MRFLTLLLLAAIMMPFPSSAQGSPSREPVRMIFDTDMGNDIDDALALAMIHALQTRGECKLLAVTLSKDNPYAATYVDLVNAFYGRGEILIGRVRDGQTKDAGRYLKQVVEARAEDGKPLYARRIEPATETPDAVALLRKTLAAQPDGSVALVMVGFSTNAARLLDSPADDVSPLTGKELIAKKVKVLSTMAGDFNKKAKKPHAEYNIVKDIPAAQKVMREWPTPVVVSPYELGELIKYPASSIERDYSWTAHHPVVDGYKLYLKFPYDRQTWDLTSALYVVRPDCNLFTLSEPGVVTVDDKGITTFAPSADGRHRILSATPEQVNRTLDAMIWLCSQPSANIK